MHAFLWESGHGLVCAGARTGTVRTECRDCSGAGPSPRCRACHACCKKPAVRQVGLQDPRGSECAWVTCQLARLESDARPCARTHSSRVCFVRLGLARLKRAHDRRDRAASSRGDNWCGAPASPRLASSTLRCAPASPRLGSFAVHASRHRGRPVRAVRSARGLHTGPKPRAGRRSNPIMPPCWDASGTPAGAPGAVPAPLLPLPLESQSARGAPWGGRADEGTPPCCAPRPQAPAPPPTHTG